MRTAAILLIGVLFAAGTATAEPAGTSDAFFGDFSFTSRKEPIEITSDRLDFDYKNRTTVFRGGVEVHQGEIVLNSDELTVTYVEVDDQQKLSGVTAVGNVTITQGARQATGKRAVFREETRTLELTGDATLVEGSNQLKGDTIVVYPDESRMEVKGQNSRVKLILFPGEEKGEEKADAPDAPATPPDISSSPAPATGTDGETEDP